VTAEKLIEGLRERGYSVIRSAEPHYVIVPRAKKDDPIVAWLAEQGANVRNYTIRGTSDVEISIGTVLVDDVIRQDGEHEYLYRRRMLEAVWKAASPQPQEQSNGDDHSGEADRGTDGD
jgi:hypothetical protein